MVAPTSSQPRTSPGAYFAADLAACSLLWHRSCGPDALFLDSFLHFGLDGRKMPCVYPLTHIPWHIFMKYSTFLNSEIGMSLVLLKKHWCIPWHIPARSQNGNWSAQGVVLVCAYPLAHTRAKPKWHLTGPSVFVGSKPVRCRHCRILWHMPWSCLPVHTLWRIPWRKKKNLQI